MCAGIPVKPIGLFFSLFFALLYWHALSLKYCVRCRLRARIKQGASQSLILMRVIGKQRVAM